MIDAGRNKTFKEADASQASVSFSVITMGFETSCVLSVENDFVTENDLNLGSVWDEKALMHTFKITQNQCVAALCKALNDDDSLSHIFTRSLCHQKTQTRVRANLIVLFKDQ